MFPNTLSSPDTNNRIMASPQGRATLVFWRRLAVITFLSVWVSGTTYVIWKGVSLRRKYCRVFILATGACLPKMSRHLCQQVQETFYWIIREEGGSNLVAYMNHECVCLSQFKGWLSVSVWQRLIMCPHMCVSVAYLALMTAWRSK